MMAIEAEVRPEQSASGKFQTLSGARMGFVSKTCQDARCIDIKFPVRLPLLGEPKIETMASVRLCFAPSMTYYRPTPLPGQAHRSSWESHVDELAEFIDVEAGGPAQIVGDSRGVHFDLQLAIGYPELVRTLTFADPAGTIELRGPASPSLPHALNLLWARSSALIGIGKHDQGLRRFVDSVSQSWFFDRSASEFKGIAFANAHALVLQCVYPSLPYSPDSAVRVRCPTPVH